MAISRLEVPGRESNEFNFVLIIGNSEFNVCEKWYHYRVTVISIISWLAGWLQGCSKPALLRSNFR
jgi:hypothetical protein